jgi:hypothetical protein
VNRTFVIGIVAAHPTEQDGVGRFIVGIPEERNGQTWIERVEVVARRDLLSVVRELRIAQPIYVDGRLEQSPQGLGRIAATRLFAIGVAPEPPNDAEAPLASHASPRPHTRVAHPRRIHLGTPQERVVWVRAAQVARR